MPISPFDVVEMLLGPNSIRVSTMVTLFDDAEVWCVDGRTLIVTRPGLTLSEAEAAVESVLPIIRRGDFGIWEGPANRAAS
jgi:hypothetical protein